MTKKQIEIAVIHFNPLVIGSKRRDIVELLPFTNIVWSLRHYMLLTTVVVVAQFILTQLFSTAMTTEYNMYITIIVDN